MNIYLLLSIIVAVVNCLNCPDGSPSKPCLRECDPWTDICYSDDSNNICCSSMFCEDTGLKSYVPQSVNAKFKMDDPRRIEWTDRTINGVDVSCPVPISALFDIDYSNEVSLKGSIENLDDVEKYPFNKNGEQWKLDGTVKVDPCSINAECNHLTTRGKTVGYCYNSRNPSLGGNRIDGTKFCYKLKEQKDSEYQVFPEKVGPVSCKENMECKERGTSTYHEEWYCHKTDIYSYSDGIKMGGICIRTRACSDYSFAIRNGGMENCDPTDSSSCHHFGPAFSLFGAVPPSRPDPNYNITCISVGRPDNYLCCQARMCLNGKPKEPRTRCSKSADCNKAMNPLDFDSYKYRCDLVDQICCDPVNEKYFVYCPDGATPLGFEKECDGYIKGDDSTGTCTNDHLNKSVTTSGMCKFGHCCPLSNVAFGQTIVGKHSFATHHPCIDGKVPDRFKHAYCDPTTDNIVVIGGLSLNGAPLTPQGNNSCTTNRDCSSGGVCVLEDSRKFCYNEETSLASSLATSSPSKDPESETSWGTLALTCLLTVLVTVCFFGACILVMWCCFIPSKSKEKIKEAAEPLKGACVCLGKKRKNKNKKSKEKAKKKEDAAEKQKMLPIDEKVKKVDEEKDKKSTSKGSTTEGSKEVSKEKEKKSEEKREAKETPVKEVAIAPKKIIIGDKAKKFLAEGPPPVQPPREQSKKTQSAKISRDKTVEVKEPNSVGSGKRNNIKECWFQGSGEDDTLEAVASLKIQFSEANTQESDKIAAKEQKKKEPREELLLPEEPAQNQ